MLNDLEDKVLAHFIYVHREKAESQLQVESGWNKDFFCNAFFSDKLLVISVMNRGVLETE